MTKIFDPTNNPDNISIGSRLNNQTNLGLFYAYHLNPFKGFEMGVSLWHNSSGSVQKPNKGINLIHFSLAYHNRLFSDVKIRQERKKYLWYEFPFQIELNTARGFHKPKTYREPRYLVSATELRLRLRVSKVVFISTDFMTEVNNENVEYYLDVRQAYNRKDAIELARRYGLSVGAEMVYGNVGIGTQLGYYVHQEVTTRPIFNKLYCRYYLPGDLKWVPKAHIGLVLKSHLGVAEYLALRIGIVFKK